MHQELGPGDSLPKNMVTMSFSTAPHSMGKSLNPNKELCIPVMKEPLPIELFLSFLSNNTREGTRTYLIRKNTTLSLPSGQEPRQRAAQECRLDQ